MSCSIAHACRAPHALPPSTPTPKSVVPYRKQYYIEEINESQLSDTTLHPSCGTPLATATGCTHRAHDPPLGRATASPGSAVPTSCAFRRFPRSHLRARITPRALKSFEYGRASSTWARLIAKIYGVDPLGGSRLRSKRREPSHLSSLCKQHARSRCHPRPLSGREDPPPSHQDRPCPAGAPFRATALRSTPNSRVGFARSSRIAEVCSRGSIARLRAHSFPCLSLQDFAIPVSAPFPSTKEPSVPHFGPPCSRAPVLAQRVMRMKIAISQSAYDFLMKSFLSRLEYSVHW
jgi:hypothetical protein